MVKAAVGAAAGRSALVALSILCAGAMPCIADSAGSQDHAMARAKISPQCFLEADIRTDERAACWRLACGSGKPGRLGCDLSQMHQVASLSVSPDRRRLAVVSVGEGHPILELVDLPALLRQRKYAMLCTVNPFPGTINVVGWSDGRVLVESDVLLTVANSDERAASLPETSGYFRVSSDHCLIEPSQGP